MTDVLSDSEFIETILRTLMKEYWGKMHREIAQNPALLKTFPGFLLNPERLIIYIHKNHLGIEYIGPERISKLPETFAPKITVHDYSKDNCQLMDEIVGFNYGGGAIRIPLTPISYDMVFPTNPGADELMKLNWNWSAQNMMLSFNSAGTYAPEDQFTRVINARFFDANPKDGLRTRHIKWLDLLPCIYDDTGTDSDQFRIWLDPLKKLAEIDPHETYPIPEDFRLDRLQNVNRFIEFVGNKTNDEPSITRMLASDEFKFLLKMRFSAKDVLDERLCEWQSESKDPIKPDFFIVKPDGYADIVEFKLPEISAPVVGKENRETFSSSINSYISQTRVYREYFDDPNNRNHVKQKYGFDVYKPKRYLVVGRRWHFDSSEWRAIAADYSDLSILTYDDLIDGVVAQFYN